MKWPFFHLSRAQSWSVGTSHNWDLILILGVDGRHWWIDRNKIKQHSEAEFRFSYPTAKVLSQVFREDFPLNIFGESSVHPCRCAASDFSALVISIVGWVIAIAVVLLEIAVLSQTE